MRLAQRVSGGLAEPLGASRVRLDKGQVVLEADADALLSETVEKRLGQFASFVGLEARVSTG